MVEVYLGEPPKHIKDWIIAHYSGGGELDKPLRFTAAEPGVSVCLNRMLNGTIDNTTEDSADKKLINLQYSLNGGAWSKYAFGMAINIDENSYVEFKALGSNETVSKSDINYYRFTIDKKVNASGNIQSLLVQDGFKDKTDVPADCYNAMFKICTGLQTAPQLPATTLATSCYFNMFNGCTSLQTAPDLPATTLANFCYAYMLYGCTKFDSVNMKKSMEGVYSGSTHGYIGKTVNYVLD